MKIRAIEQRDNQQMGALIQHVLIEHEVPKKAAYSDPFSLIYLSTIRN